jgi:hypothetical protein
MKLTHQELDKKIQEYIDDMHSYGNESEITLNENVLKSLKMLLVESDGISKSTLVEAANNSQGESKYIIEDFILYIEN